MKREGRGPCEIEFDEYVFITRKKNRLVRHSLTITSFTKKTMMIKTSEGCMKICFGFAFNLFKIPRKCWK